jgi:glycosyltransferase 2 family protein
VAGFSDERGREDPETVSAIGDLIDGLRDATTRERTDGTTRRRPGDAARVVVTVLVLIPLALHANHPTATESAVVKLFDSIPHGARTLFLILYQLAALWAVGLLVVTVLLLRRWRLARDLVVAAGAAWILGRLLAFLVDRSDLWKAFQVTFDLTGTPRFPLVRVSVAVAAVLVASPHLTRPTRRVGEWLVALLALTSLYLARGVPTDLVAALVLGWGVAHAVEYAFGTPVGRPSVREVAHALVALGVDATGVELAHEQPVGRAIFRATTADQLPIRVVALGRDEADAQLLARTWRFLAYRDAPPTLLLTRRAQIDYEAYLTLLARDAGVRAPRVVAAGTTGPLALLVVEQVPGLELYDLDADAVSDALLDAIWEQVRVLHGARIAHGKLDGRHIVVDGDAPCVVGFDFAASSTAPRLQGGDVAQLLAATAAIVGAERAVEAGVRGLGTDVIARALPVLQAPALSGWTHDALGGRGELDDELDALRTAGAAATGTEVPELRRLYRVQPRSLLMAVGALVGVGVLLSRVGDPQVFWDTVKNAEWGFVLLAFVLGIATDVAFGITFLGNVPMRLPVWPSIELQSAMSFSNLAVPVAADTALQVRFLQRNGLDLSSAVAAGGILSSVSEIIVQVGLLFLALWLAPDSIDFGRIDTNQIVVVVLIAMLAVGIAAAVVFSVRRIRHAVLPPIRRALTTVWAAVKSPSRLGLLIAGNVIAQCLYAASLLACLHAYGAGINFWTLLALNIGISVIASLVPIPGGGTAVSAVGLAGMVTAFGVPAAAASAAVLTHQLAVTYLPAIPGWFATNDLVRKGML